MVIIDELAKLKEPKELTKREVLLLALESEDRALLAEAKILEQAPKVEFYDQVADTTTSFDMQEVSAMLKLSYGRNVLFRKLRDAGVLMKDNLPYRNLLDEKKFIVVESKWINPRTDQVTATTQTRITQKGLDWLQKNKEKLNL
jgi:anti-repressor protein